jgi:hypothetical protein
MLSEKRKAYLRKYRKQNRDKQAIYYKKWYDKHGRQRKQGYAQVSVLYDKHHIDARHARDSVKDAIKSGKLQKPTRCIICNQERYLNAHHSDYKKRLDVAWVCSSCHKKIHLNLI